MITVGFLSVVGSFGAGTQTHLAWHSLLPSTGAESPHAEAAPRDTDIDIDAVVALLRVFRSDTAAATQWQITDRDGDGRITLADAILLLHSFTRRGL